jgi:hypothetical protein
MTELEPKKYYLYNLSHKLCSLPTFLPSSSFFIQSFWLLARLIQTSSQPGLGAIELRFAQLCYTVNFSLSFFLWDGFLGGFESLAHMCTVSSVEHCGLLLAVLHVPFYFLSTTPWFPVPISSHPRVTGIWLKFSLCFFLQFVGVWELEHRLSPVFQAITNLLLLDVWCLWCHYFIEFVWNHCLKDEGKSDMFLSPGLDLFLLLFVQIFPVILTWDFECIITLKKSSISNCI